jgi:hypothetical protein
MTSHAQEALSTGQDPRLTTQPREDPVWSRDDAIGRLRFTLEKLTDGEHSMCQIAADQGVFCRGFRRWNDAEFHRKWSPAIGSSTFLTRVQMERFANLWQLMEQARLRVVFACDAEALCPGACRGWDEFGNEQLARYCAKVLNTNVQVVDSL